MKGLRDDIAIKKNSATAGTAELDLRLMMWAKQNYLIILFNNEIYSELGSVCHS
jgi:hypothetical protein